MTPILCFINCSNICRNVSHNRTKSTLTLLLRIPHEYDIMLCITFIGGQFGIGTGDASTGYESLTKFFPF